MRRQYSQQEPPTGRRLSSSDNGIDILSPGHRHIQSQGHQYVQQQQIHHQYDSQQENLLAHHKTAVYPEDDPKFYQVMN